MKRGSRGRLAAYIVLLAGLMLAEAAATLLLLTDNAWRARIPGAQGQGAGARKEHVLCSVQGWPARRTCDKGCGHARCVQARVRRRRPSSRLARPLARPLVASLRVPPADDPSGRWAEAQEFVQANARGCRLAAVAAMGAELAALAAACWLHAIYTAAYEAWLDDR